MERPSGRKRGHSKNVLEKVTVMVAYDYSWIKLIVFGSLVVYFLR